MKSKSVRQQRAENQFDDLKLFKSVSWCCLWVNFCFAMSESSETIWDG